MYSVSSFAEDILYGSDKPGIVVRKRAVRTHCAASYLSDKQELLDMCRARICRMWASVPTTSTGPWRPDAPGEHRCFLEGDYDCDISLRRAYQLAEAIGLRKAAFGVDDTDLVKTAAPSPSLPAAAVPAR